MKYKVLITTSGVGSRIGDLTKFSNKSLVRIGDKPALSHIVEQYPDDVEIVVTIGHFGDHVKQFLNLAYPNRKITFVNVDKYEGQGSSLAYSILQAKNYLDCPFIFHACDTIVSDNIVEPTHNWLGGFSQVDNEHYVSFDVSGQFVTNIREKGTFGGDFSYIGLAGIYNHNEFFNYLSQSYIANKENSQLSDVISIKAMLEEGLKFSYYSFNWHDIGNIESLKNTRSQISGKLNVLDKNDESIYIVNNNIIKFFYNNNICKNRVKRAELLGKLVPNIIASSENFYKYSFVEGQVLADYITEEKFKQFLSWSKDNLWIEKSHDNFKQLCYDFYFNKTKERIYTFLNNSGLKDDTCHINGLKIPPIIDMLNDIDIDWLCGGTPYQIHGDYILDNTLFVSDNNFMLVDWRQDFGGNIEVGDIYYDLAKLNHNLIFNHDLVHKGLFEIKMDDQITCDILRKNILVNCQHILFDFIKNNNLDHKKVTLLSAVIWINMSPLHKYNLSQFLFYFGKYNLYKSIYEIL